MKRFHTRLPGSRREPPGFERILLRRLPALLIAGTLLPALYALAVQWLAPHTAAGVRVMQTAQYTAFGVVLFHWMAVMMTSLICTIVAVMKGHAVAADAYALPDAERCDRDRPRR